MSISNILLDQNFNANNADIMEFESSVSFTPRRSLGGIDNMVLKLNTGKFNVFYQHSAISRISYAFAFPRPTQILLYKRQSSCEP